MIVILMKNLQEITRAVETKLVIPRLGAKKSGLGLDGVGNVNLEAPLEKAVASGSSADVKMLAIFGLDFKDVDQYYDKILLAQDPRGCFRRMNSFLLPFIKALNDANLQFNQVTPLDHCSALVTRTEKDGKINESVKLREGRNANKDRPGVILTKGSRTKVYVYHIVALVTAIRNPGPRLTPDLLRSVSQEKSEKNAQTILHLCGHHWCLTPGHLAVGSKVLNDEQTACHGILQSAKSLEEHDSIQKNGCKHMPKCWTIIYGGEFRDVVSWALQ